MNSNIKENYELSIWSRINSTTETYQLTIGSSSMTAPWKAQNLIVKSNVNGEKTLSFNLYTRYFDSDIGEFKDNFLLDYLHNETLIKLHRGTNPTEGWEEFIIKGIAENSENKTCVYTAKGAWPLELGKTGYGVTFSSDLMNNTGTALELATQAFEGTDWQVSIDSNCKFWGSKAEPLYKATLNTKPTSTCIRQANIGDYNLYFPNVLESVETIPGDAIIYIPYTSYQQYLNDATEIQCLWDPTGAYEKDSDGLIYTANSYIITGFSFSDPTIQLDMQGDYLSNREKSYYLGNIDKVVTEGIIKDNNNKEKTVCYYTDTSYLTNDTVQELVVNGHDFTDTQGWRALQDKTSVSLNYEDDNVNVGDIVSTNYKTEIVLKNDNNSVSYIYNSAIRSNLSILCGTYGNRKGISKGDKFVIDWVNGKKNNKPWPMQVLLAPYAIMGSGKLLVSESGAVFNGLLCDSENKVVGGESYRTIVSANTDVSYSALQDGVNGVKYGLFVKVEANWLVSFSSLSVYKYKEGEVQKINEDGTLAKDKEENVILETRIITPSDVPTAKTITENHYVLKDDVMNTDGSQKDVELEDVTVYNLQSGETFNGTKYGDSYERISSIDVSKSNRFNILQEICEGFECWADIQVEHNAGGSVKKGADGSPIKKIVLKNFIGDNKNVGFTYGINLKSIQRQVVSDQIATKLIVEQNNNENAQNGFCTIVRAGDNVTKTNAIYDFSYYINQNMIKEEDIGKDLYNSEGALAKIGEANAQVLYYDQLIIEQESALFTCKKDLAAAEEIRDGAEVELERLKEDFFSRTGKYYDAAKLADTNSKYLSEEQQKDSTIKEITYCIKQQEALYTTEANIIEKNNEKIKTINSSISSYTNKRDGYYDKVKDLINSFENKYAAFIQESTWTDEAYYDDNLYYYDAVNILHTSTFPKVTYTIDAIDLYPLSNNYAAFNFKLGDKTYVEDTEFFGWKNGVTPYREEVVISSMEEHLDQPENNKITVQNYKTQFEDLFQRVAATTQTLQYAAGAYQRAANKITEANEIDLTTLQNSIYAGLLNLQNMGNMSIAWTEKGLMVSSTDSATSHKQLRLSNTGLSLSTDGGQTWKTAITGEGIKAEVVTSGSINTEKVTIRTGDVATFIWDAKGLRAYEKTFDADGNATLNSQRYIEFNDVGLIAYNKENNTKTFQLLSDGTLELTGKITATSGKIGNLILSNWKLFGTAAADATKKNVWVSGLNGGFEYATNNTIFLWAGARGGTDNSESDTRKTFGSADWTDAKNIVENTASFYVTHTGELHAAAGEIGGWYIGKETLSSTNDKNSEGIVLDASSSTIYSKQYGSTSGGTGWKIDNNEAVFNNITLRGALKCAVLEYAKVQAIGGVMLVRPASTIKGASYTWSTVLDKTGSFILTLALENGGLFNSGDWCKFTTEAAGDTNITCDDGTTILRTGINTNLFKVHTVYSTSKDIVFSLTLAEIQQLTGNTDIKEGDEGTIPQLEGLGLVNLGTIGSIGLGLNSSDNHALIPGQSFSVFSFEEVTDPSDSNQTWKYLHPHIILGKLPDDPFIKEKYRSTYGLYAENVQLTGEINATSGKIGNLILSNWKLFGTAAADATKKNVWVSGLNGGFEYATNNTIFLWAGARGGTDNSESDTRKTFGSADWTDAKNIVENTASFYVTHTGELHAAAGEIGGWTIDTELGGLYHVPSIESNSVGIGVQGKFAAFWAGGTLNDAKLSDDGGRPVFYVTHDGKLVATNAYITGTITAKNGKIGNWHLEGYKLFSLANRRNTKVSGMNGVYSGSSYNTIFLWSGVRMGDRTYSYNDSDVITVNEDPFTSTDKDESKVYYNTADKLYWYNNTLRNWESSNDGKIGLSQGETQDIFSNNADWRQAYCEITGNSIIVNDKVIAAPSDGNSPAKFYVTHEGELHATNAYISGTISATQGYIGRSFPLSIGDKGIESISYFRDGYETGTPLSFNGVEEWYDYNNGAGKYDQLNFFQQLDQGILYTIASSTQYLAGPTKCPSLLFRFTSDASMTELQSEIKINGQGFQYKDSVGQLIGITPTGGLFIDNESRRAKENYSSISFQGGTYDGLAILQVQNGYVSFEGGQLNVTSSKTTGAIRGLWGGEKIPAATANDPVIDLNSETYLEKYFVPGVYGIDGYANTANLKGLPVRYAGSLVVFAPLGIDDSTYTNQYRYQEFIPYLNPAHPGDHFFYRRTVIYTKDEGESEKTYKVGPWFKYSGTKVDTTT